MWVEKVKQERIIIIKTEILSKSNFKSVDFCNDGKVTIKLNGSYRHTRRMSKWSYQSFTISEVVDYLDLPQITYFIFGWMGGILCTQLIR